MMTGLLLIVFGLLVAVFPQILVAMVSAILVLTGLSICLMSWQWRRVRRVSESPFVNWIVRW